MTEWKNLVGPNDKTEEDHPIDILKMNRKSGDTVIVVWWDALFYILEIIAAASYHFEPSKKVSNIYCYYIRCSTGVKYSTPRVMRSAIKKKRTS